MDPRFPICNGTNFFDPHMEYCQREGGEDMNLVVVCFKKTVTHIKGMWRAENALAASLPLLFLQLFIILCLNRVLVLALRRLRIARIAAEILGGILLGPSCLGQISVGYKILFPYSGIMTLESIANLGIIYYMFLVGLEVDVKPVVRAGKKAWSIALAGLILPFPVGYGLHLLLLKNQEHDASTFGPIFWGLVLGTTNFPDLARILADHKLLHTDVGRTALSSAVINDILSWISFVFALASKSDGHYKTIACTCLFVLFYILALGPAVEWMLRRTGGDDVQNNQQVMALILAGVIASAYITDSLGCQSIVGAFMFGVILPKGDLKHALFDTLEDFVSSLMTPLFFLMTGLRTDFHQVFHFHSHHLQSYTFLAVLFLSFSTKIVSTFCAALFFNRFKPRDALALGFLMNTKGLVALIITNSARDLLVLSTHTYSVMVSCLWLMTAAVGPLIFLLYRTSLRSSRHYKNQTIRSLENQPLSEFRILSCIPSDASSVTTAGLVSLLALSNPSKQSPISAFAVSLVELVGHASAMLIVHDTCNNSGDDLPSADSVSKAFQPMERNIPHISLQSLTAMSSYSTMHEDICNLADDKRVALILLPFHPHLLLSEERAHANSPFRGVNRHVLDNASCSVAVFVNRGLKLNDPNYFYNLATAAPTHGDNSSHRRRDPLHIAMLFVGGRDDREALAYAWRMCCGNPNVSLMVMRFVPSKEAAEKHMVDDHEHDDNPDDILDAINDREREKQLDDHYVEGLKHKAMIIKNSTNNSASRVNLKMAVVEVSNGDEIIKVLSDMDQQFDLYVVGKGRGALPALTSGFSEWSEWPELGPLGDVLVSSSFAPNASILIVQQGFVSPDDHYELQEAEVGQVKDNLNGHMTWHPPVNPRPHFAPFVHRKHKLNDNDDDL